MGSAEAGVGSPECLLSQERIMPTLINEVALMLLLLAAVVISGRL